MKRLRILTWHVHGSYLYYLAHAPHDFYLPVRASGESGYTGRTASFPWPDNVHEVSAEDVRELALDGILYQHARHYLVDRHALLSDRQLRLPQVYLEHDPPRGSPTDTLHPVQDRNVLLVHCTPFNRLMWDSGVTPTRVIDHGVTVPEGARYRGDLARGLVVINNLAQRGRRLGADVYARLQAELPLDLVGMGWAEVAGGVGEIPPRELPAFMAAYRFFFNPIRYTSLGLAILEAMMVGLPVVGLATTELVTVIENGVSGYLATDPDELVGRAATLLADPALARRLGDGARRTATARFGIDRFARDWSETLLDVMGGVRAPRLTSQELVL